MSDEITSASTGAPAAPAPAPAPAAIAAPVAPAIAAATTAPAPAPAAPAQPDLSWLPDRLKRAEDSARTTLLADLGVTSPEEAKAAVAAAKAAADAKKSAEERAAEAATEAKAAKATADHNRGLFKEITGRMFMALSPEQQKAVTEFAGDDPEKQYAAIKHFGPTWAAAEQAKEDAAKAAAALKAAAAPAASTSPAPAAPSSETPASPADPKSVYSTTRSTNPFKAAAYGLANPGVYESK